MGVINGGNDGELDGGSDAQTLDSGNDAQLIERAVETADAASQSSKCRAGGERWG